MKTDMQKQFEEDETIWRVSDVIASGSSKAIYKTTYWKAMHNGFNCFKTKEEAEKARDIILDVLNGKLKQSSQETIEKLQKELEKAESVLKAIANQDSVKLTGNRYTQENFSQFTAQEENKLFLSASIKIAENYFSEKEKQDKENKDEK